jgi:signal transduction histidine kinase/ActR/RegA family two-component response regulator
MTPSHRLLARQIRKHFPAGIPDVPEMKDFLAAVEVAYEHFDADRTLLDRAMKLSSDELSAALSDVQRQHQLEREVLEKLRASVRALQTDGGGPAPDASGGQDLAHLASVIERLVAERNESKRALIAAKEAAESSSRAKSEFLAVMSHEIRTPLNSVIGFASIMAENPRQDHSANLAIIRSSAEHLLALLNDILDFSKIEASRLELERRPVDLRRLAEGVLEFARVDAEKKRIRLTCENLHTLPPLVIGDASRLRQILVNLLSNAVKFTNQGGVTLRADAVREGNLWNLSVSVSDTGIGIAAESMPRLFQAFSQVDSSNIRQHGGTGLGLAISRRLAEMMGGSLEVVSTLGRGSTFTFRLRAEAAVAPPVVPLYKAPGSTPPTAPPLRILVVEDNENNRRFMRMLLEGEGHRCTFAVDGREALRALAHPRDFDLVLLDIQMPEVDGFDVLTAFRRDVPLNQPPYIIALSANVRPEDQRNAVAAGAHEFIGKPVPLATVRAAITRTRAWLETHR